MRLVLAFWFATCLLELLIVVEKYFPINLLQKKILIPTLLPHTCLPMPEGHGCDSTFTTTVCSSSWHIYKLMKMSAQAFIQCGKGFDFTIMQKHADVFHSNIFTTTLTTSEKRTTNLLNIARDIEIVKTCTTKEWIQTYVWKQMFELPTLIFISICIQYFIFTFIDKYTIVPLPFVSCTLSALFTLSWRWHLLWWRRCHCW